MKKILSILPDRVSRKKSYPLPRDIIARTLGKMSISIFPVLLEALESEKAEIVSETLDAVGFMAFYNKCISLEKYLDSIYFVMERFEDESLVLWKSIICLSAFPFKSSLESLRVIKEKHPNSLLYEEAARSENIIKNRMFL